MNLTETSYFARTIIKVFFFLLTIYVLALVFKKPIKTGLQTIIPPKDPPNPAYGKLSPLEFVAQPISGAIESFELNTPNGKLPEEMPNKMIVYKYVPNFFSFEAGKKSQENALILGYTPEEIISDFKSDKYIWRDITYGGLLTIDLPTQYINLLTPYSSIGGNYKLGSITETQALTTATELLGELDKFKDQLYLQGTSKVVLGRFLGGRLIQASTPVEAQLAQIDYFRSINKFPILGPDPKKGLIRLVLGNPTVQNQKLSNPTVQIYEWPIDTISNASYPIIPVQVAWDNVAKGNGVIANVTSGSQSPFEPAERTSMQKVFIENIYLAYYDNTKPQEYLQPIYVFEGKYNSLTGDKGSVTIYYPAIDGSFIKGTEELEPTTNTPDAKTSPPDTQQ